MDLLKMHNKETFEEDWAACSSCQKKDITMPVPKKNYAYDMPNTQ